MKHDIYNVSPAIVLSSSGVEIYLQSISLSHAYGGLVCGTPNEQINDNIIAEAREDVAAACFIIRPTVTMVSENDFFDNVTLHTQRKTIPLLPAVKVEALFECYDGDRNTFLHIAWFQDDFSEMSLSSIENKIQDIDWHCYACGFTL